MSLNCKMKSYGMPISGQKFFQKMVPEVTENWLNSSRQGFVLMYHIHTVIIVMLIIRAPSLIVYWFSITTDRGISDTATYMLLSLQIIGPTPIMSWWWYTPLILPHCTAYDGLAHCQVMADEPGTTSQLLPWRPIWASGEFLRRKVRPRSTRVPKMSCGQLTTITDM